jgi:hypothetical protein
MKIAGPRPLLLCSVGATQPLHRACSVCLGGLYLTSITNYSARVIAQFNLFQVSSLGVSEETSIISYWEGD